MSRFPIVDPKTATGPAKVLLDAVQAQFGVTPNYIRVLANSPKALEGFLGLYGATAGFAVDRGTRERIALAVAEANGCQYCVSAHTTIGRAAGLSNEEILLNRKGTSGNAKAIAAVVFARALNDNVGEVTALEVEAARAAGLSDGELVEIITVVAMNIFTNILNKATHVDIDFPEVALLSNAQPIAV